MNKLKSLLILLISVISVSTASAQKVNEIIAKYNEGVAFFKQKDYDKSIEVLKSAYDMSMSSEEEGAFDLGSKVETTLGSAYFNKGKKAAGAKNFDAALVDMKKALEIFTSLNDIRNKNQVKGMISKVYEVKAVTLSKAGDLGGAIKACEDGLKDNPNATSLSLFAAKMKYQKGDIDGAFADYNKLYAFSKRSSRYTKVAKAVNSALLSNAAQAAKDKNVAMAEKNIAVVLANNPTNSVAQMQRLQIYNAAKQYNLVVKYADEAIASQTEANNKATLSFITGAAYQVLKNNDSAVKYYKQVTMGQYQSQAKTIITSLTKK